MTNALLRRVMFLVVTACLTLTACDRDTGSDARANRSTLEQIEATHTVVAGWIPYLPYEYLDPKSMKPTGFYVELFERLASEAGFKVKWVETTWGTMIADLKSGRFEVMVSPVFRTIPRASQVAFVRPIDYFGISGIARIDDTRFRGLTDFRKPDTIIAVTEGESGYEYATRHLPLAKLHVFKTGDISLSLMDVVQHRADIAIADDWIVKQFVAQHKSEVRDLFPDHPFNRVGASWFVRREDIELLVFLSTSVDWLFSSGEVSMVARKYKLGSKLAEN